MKYLQEESSNSGFDQEQFAAKSFEHEERYLRAKKKVDKLVGFYWHLAVYVVINLFLISMIALRSDGVSFFRFGTFSTAFFWGIGLLFHFLGVFGPDMMLGKNWEQKKMQEFIDEDKQRWE